MVFLLMALYNYNGLVAPTLSLDNFRFQLTRLFCVLVVHRVPGKKATVPVY